MRTLDENRAAAEGAVDVQKKFTFKEVERGPEFRRIRALERRPPPKEDDPELVALADYLTKSYAKNDAPYPGPMRPLIAASLKEAAEQRGFVGMLQPGAGKAQPNSEPVLTKSGWRPIGELRVGDEIYGSDGQTQTVLGVYPQGRRDVARVRFTDGTEVLCDWDHLWTFDRRRMVGRTSVKERSTKTLREWAASTLTQTMKQGSKKHLLFAPMLTSPVEEPEQQGPVDPYTLGLLLGDGGMTSHTVSFTTADQELVDGLVLPEGVRPVRTKLQGSGKATSYLLTRGRKVGPFNKNPLVAALESLGLQGRGSADKFVPDCYRGPKTRLAVLQGLIDTDGHVARAGRVDYCCASPELAAWVQETVHLLGGTTHRTVKVVNYRGEDRQYHRVSFVLPSRLCPARLKRKAEAASVPRQREPYRAVSSIEAAGAEECTCIYVSNLDSLYLTRNCVLTHNTFLSYMMPAAVGVERALYMCPSGLIPDVQAEFVKFARDWDGPRLHSLPIMAYEQLAHPDAGEVIHDDGTVLLKSLLARMAPKLIILDECHRCGDTGSVTCQRINAYLEENPDVIVVAYSGTLFKTSIKDAEHIMRWCLGDRSPLPQEFFEREAWASHLDVRKSAVRARIGGLVDFLEGPERRDYNKLTFDDDRRNVVRRAVARWILSTPGIIGTSEPAIDTPLSIEAIFPEREDPRIDELFDQLRALEALPDGTPLADGMQVARVEATFGKGFWQKWVPPPPFEYRDAWKGWSKWCSKMLKHNRRKIDSEALMKRAVRKGLYDDEGLLGAWEEQVLAYREATGLLEPPSVAQWESSEAVECAMQWIEQYGGIVWTDYIALGEVISERAGIPYYGEEGLDQRGRHIKNHPGGPAVASIQANGTGRNLQRFWSDNLWLCTPTEQALARTHRAGQTAPIVRNWVYVGCARHLKSFWYAYNEKSVFAEIMSGSPQRMRYAELDMPILDELAHLRGIGKARWAVEEE